MRTGFSTSRVPGVSFDDFLDLARELVQLRPDPDR